MTPQEQAASLTRDEIASLLVSHRELTARNGELSSQNSELSTRVNELSRQVDWFKRQMFGSKSERRLLATPDGRQLALGEQLATTSPEPESKIKVPSHTRRRRKPAWETGSDDSGLRFDPSVPVTEIQVPNPEIADLPPDSYTVVGTKETYRLAQEAGAYKLLRYVRQVVKLKKDETFSCPPAPPSVLEKSFADVSLLAGILLDKFLFHLPLYRQHQRMLATGVHLGRSTLTLWTHRSIDLLMPIYEAQWASVLQSKVLAMDETPVKAGRVKPRGRSPGKMKTGFYWPVFGDRDEVVFPFSPSRSHAVVDELLGAYTGPLLSDGYEAYSRFAAKVEGLVHALCWSHLRRYFIDSESIEPELSQKALDQIASLYAHEATVRDRGLEGQKKLEYRAMHCKPLVDDFFEWLRELFHKHILLPTNPFTKAINYGLEREVGLRVFLEDPDVPIDTNHLERQVRPIAMGRRAWLFCWTEVGAQCVGVIHSLLATCRLQGVNPRTYLVDVLQRVETHPARDVHLLTPRLWKQHFADQPLQSDLDRIRHGSNG